MIHIITAYICQMRTVTLNVLIHGFLAAAYDNGKCKKFNVSS